MKTLKYRSVVASLMVASLSVFLFTACEKESDSEPTTTPSIDRISKFKRLTFSSGSTSTTTSSTSTGTITGGGGNKFADAGGSDNSFELSGSEVTFTDTDTDVEFVDPQDAGPVFGIQMPEGSGDGSSAFSFGSGDFWVDMPSNSYSLEYVVCLDADILGRIPTEDSLGNPIPTENVKVIVGIDVEGTADVSDPSELSNLSFAHLVYIVQYNGGTDIGGPDNFNAGNVDGFVFGFIIPFTNNEAGDILWMGSASTLDIDGGMLEGNLYPEGNTSVMIPFAIDFNCGN